MLIRHTVEAKMQSMIRLIQHRRLRGLAIHHRLHPSKHARRLVTRTAAWGEPPVRGVCRWCGELTSNVILTWHLYCLDAYRVASGQKLQMQVTMCESCGRVADELDHRLAINVARALGPAALRRAFTQENLAWLCRECHLRKTRFDRLLARYLRACRMDWHGAIRAWESNREWASAFLAPFGLDVDVRSVTKATSEARPERVASMDD